MCISLDFIILYHRMAPSITCRCVPMCYRYHPFAILRAEQLPFLHIYQWNRKWNHKWLCLADESPTRQPSQFTIKVQFQSNYYVKSTQEIHTLADDFIFHNILNQINQWNYGINKSLDIKWTILRIPFAILRAEQLPFLHIYQWNRKWNHKWLCLADESPTRQPSQFTIKVQFQSNYYVKSTQEIHTLADDFIFHNILNQINQWNYGINKSLDIK